jgi:hypothetical protein
MEMRLRPQQRLKLKPTMAPGSKWTWRLTTNAAAISDGAGAGVEAIAGYALRILKPDGRTVFVKPTKAVLRSAAPAGGVKGVIGSFDDESDDEPEDAGYEIVDGW